MCPAKAGVFSRRETYQGKSQSPVARRAGGRETNLLKPLDSPICGMGASLQAVAQANAQVAPKVIAPEAEPATVKAKAAWPVANGLMRWDTPAGWLSTAWWQGRAKQLEKPSSSRREIGGAR